MKEAHESENKNILLGVVMVTSFINPFMGAAINIALPHIAKELNMGTLGMSWVGMSFLLSSAVFLVPMGKIADIKGRKRIFLYGNIIVTLASAICALAQSPAILLTGRVVQGIGASMMFGTGMALVTSAFPPQKRGKAIGLVVSAVYLGLSAAPVLGGLLTQYWGWRSLFYITIPIGALVVILTATLLKNDWADARQDPFDWRGSLVYILSMSVLMIGFTKLPNPLAILASIFGLAGIIGFVRLEMKTASPVINIQLFRHNRIFAFSNLAALINYAATFAISFLLSLYLQYIKGLSPRDTGLLLITQPIVMTIFASISGRLSDRYNPNRLSSMGMSIIVLGLMLLVAVDAETSGGYIMAVLVVLGMGFGLFSSPNTNAIMSSVQKQELGIASATVSTMRLTGQMFSMGLATMILQIYLGSTKSIIEQPDNFIRSFRTAFILFALLCMAGVFAALARHRKQTEAEAE
ncbi:MAG: MFS transporter [Breznakibacter sp.]